MQETLVRFPGREDLLEKGQATHSRIPVVSLAAQLVKNPPARQMTWVLSLGWEDPPGEGNGYPLQDSGLENPMDGIVHGVTKSRT